MTEKTIDLLADGQPLTVIAAEFDVVTGAVTEMGKEKSERASPERACGYTEAGR
jgi:hypothetical protein